jgi:hypothetical protein
MCSAQINMQVRFGSFGIVVSAIVMIAVGAFLATILVRFSQPQHIQVSPSDRAQPVEWTMSPGMEIEAVTPSGRIVVRAESETQRTFTWDDSRCTATIDMWRRHSRWDPTGGFGLYFPGPGRNFEACGSVCRIVAEEGRLYFESQQAAQAWIAEEGELFPQSMAYNDRGLFVRWNKVIEREQLNVNVWQIVVAGQLPTALTGSDNSAIHIRYLRLETLVHQEQGTKPPAEQPSRQRNEP